MALAEETEMTAAQVDDFLAERESGVLSLARDERPYAIPISYGYDSSERTFYMRLVSTPESEKREFLSSNPAARLVVYDSNTQGTEYKSVVASGDLAQIDPDELTIEQIEQYGSAKRPLFEIWGQERDSLDIQLFRFRPDELNGRLTEVDRDES
ncbi:pyridoxamine 5'-phosphate oxidase family protein [Halovenus marina]|uniref:pyridoxamine 5'-phosphate oxidase family protein n=1 Tax=Halovenus marina TaxID=3396621 RepID=UPI003F562AE3